VAMAEWLCYARSYARCEPSKLTDRELAGRVYRQARCASSRLEPDEWFPLALDVAKARDQAASAIAICAGCPVRADCLELSLRHPFDIGAYGVWGGLVEGERRALRRQWLAGTRVAEFL
jgi:WhiB family transcriptional regulator, redox-sensing transcriptional regulator